MLNPQSIDVSEGAVVDLLMTFSRNVASVGGDVEVKPDQSKRSVHVLLLSVEERYSLQPGLLWPLVDQTFRFSKAEMRPGKYLAFAVEDDDQALWESADFVSLLEPQGTEVTLHEKEHSNVHLKLIPKDETDAIRKRLGL